MRCVYLCSRDWSLQILRSIILDEHIKIELVICTPNVYRDLNGLFPSLWLVTVGSYADLAQHIPLVNSLHPDVVLCYGWSGYLQPALTDIYTCLILHPSRLPEYRGGSPIQNQIINGVSISSVSIIQACRDIDAGPLLYQSTLSLKGNLREIKELIAFHGVAGTKYISLCFAARGGFYSVDQDNSASTFFSRRTPEMSEITMEDLQEKRSSQIASQVRCLQDDYPLAYIKCAFNTRLYLLDVKHD